MLAWNSSWGDVEELGTHRGYVSEPRPLPNTTGLELGQVISFSYKTKEVSETTNPVPGPSPRLTFVMHPNFEGKCHALTLKKLSRDQMLEFVYPHIRDGMTDPETFYYAVYKPNLYHTDAYRTYMVSKMYAVTSFYYSAPTPGSDADKMEKFLGPERSDEEMMRQYDRELEKGSNK